MGHIHSKLHRAIAKEKTKQLSGLYKLGKFACTSLRSNLSQSLNMGLFDFDSVDL